MRETSAARATAAKLMLAPVRVQVPQGLLGALTGVAAAAGGGQGQRRVARRVGHATSS